MKTFISDFISIAPRHSLPQETAIEYLVKLREKLGLELTREQIKHRIRKFGLADSKIQFRSTELEVLEFFSSEKPVPTLDERIQFYSKCVTEVFKKIYSQVMTFPDHLIHVSCTGYVSPSAAQATALQWLSQKNTQVTHAYHMGCFAAFPALRIARGFVSDPETPDADIVHTELCSLHFDSRTLEPEQIVVQSLFADGHIRYRVSSALPKTGFEICTLREELIADSADAMTWIPSSTHFKMQLSRHVPHYLQDSIRPFVGRLLEAAHLSLSSELIFAIHPGGPKIIEAVEHCLELRREQTIESHEVLAERGNMSSATLPHVWKSILENPNRKHGDYVVTMAFGPGLTISGGILQLCRS